VILPTIRKFCVLFRYQALHTANGTKHFPIRVEVNVADASRIRWRRWWTSRWAALLRPWQRNTRRAWLCSNAGQVHHQPWQSLVHQQPQCQLGQQVSSRRDSRASNQSNQVKWNLLNNKGLKATYRSLKQWLKY